jgi:uncharacterized protein YceK
MTRKFYNSFFSFWFISIASIVLTLLPGCATCLIRTGHYIDNEPEVFPSTRANFYVVGQCLGMNNSGSSGLICIPASCSPLDLPLALATDTIMLPIDGYRSFTAYRNRKFWDMTLSQKEVKYPLEDYNTHTKWMRVYLSQKLKNDRHGLITSDLIELIYRLQPSVITFDDIQYHPNLSPSLLDKIANEARSSGSSYLQIASHKNTSAETLVQMYKNTESFYTRGWIVNHPNSPEGILNDFIDKALHDSDKKNKYWAVAGVHRIPTSLFDDLSKDSDPLVRQAVASNYFAPLNVIRGLLNDVDQTVQYRARENIRLRDRFQKDFNERYGLSQVNN